MYAIYGVGGSANPKATLRTFLLDYLSDIDNLPHIYKEGVKQKKARVGTEHVVAAGSKAIVIEDGSTWILSNEDEWCPFKIGKGGSSGGGGSDDGGIKTVTGDDENPVILSELENGNYIVGGTYKKSADDTEKHEADQLAVSVMTDKTTDNRIVTYDAYDDGTLKKVIAEVSEDGKVISETTFDYSGGEAKIYWNEM